MLLPKWPQLTAQALFMQLKDVVEPLLHFSDLYAHVRQKQNTMYMLTANHIYPSATNKFIINQLVGSQSPNSSKGLCF